MNKENFQISFVDPYMMSSSSLGASTGTGSGVAVNSATANHNNNYDNYQYSDRDCESLRQRGHDVYCTYDKDSINDDSLYFNLDRTIDLDKKRYKTCYDEDCMDTSNNKN